MFATRGETSLMSQKRAVENGPDTLTRSSFENSHRVNPPIGLRQLGRMCRHITAISATPSALAAFAGVVQSVAHNAMGKPGRRYSVTILEN